MTHLAPVKASGSAAEWSCTCGHVTALSCLIDGRMAARELSNRDVARLSGDAISQGAVGQYRAGRNTSQPTDRTLRALASTLGIPLRDLYIAAGAKDAPVEWVPPAEAHRMDRRMRDHVERTIKLLVASAAEREAGAA